MGKGISLPEVENQQLIDKLSKTLDDDTKRLLKECVDKMNREKASLLKQIEALKNNTSSMQLELQKHKKILAETEKDRHKWLYEAQGSKNDFSKDKLQKKIQKFLPLDDYSSTNQTQQPQRSYSYQEIEAVTPKESTLLENLNLEVQKLQTDKQILFEENEKLKRDNKVLEEEKENLLSRLSKLAGTQLTKGNTGLADLSDANRPTNLANKWSALYTDEWSEAYDALLEGTNTNENYSAEKQLCSIVQKCYDMCKNIEERQIKSIKTHVWDVACCLHQRPDQLISATKTSLYRKVQRDVESTKKAATINPRTDVYADEKVLAIHKCMEELIQIVHERRKYDEQLLQYVIQETVQHFTKCYENQLREKILYFVRRCTELCWYMVITDPPVVLLSNQMEGKPIDRSLFSIYTESGPIIDFVVWPALFLHKDGPILSKGVVQCQNKDKDDASNKNIDADGLKKSEKGHCKDVNKTRMSAHQSDCLKKDPEGNTAEISGQY